MKKYHAHFYFELSEQNFAQALANQMKEIFSPAIIVGELYLKTVGPHPLPMFTVMFAENHKTEVIQFLELHRGQNSVIIHSDTGNDFFDHTQGALWLGKPLNINFEHFERVKYDKSALVFAPQ